MDADLTLPRELTEKEETALRKLLNSQLHITKLIQDEEDAEVLLDYAFDMIKGGDNIGQVVEEIVFMEMSVCRKEEGEKIGSVLTDFYNQMGTLEEAAAKEARAKELEVTIAAHAEEEALATEAKRVEEEEDFIAAALETNNKSEEEGMLDGEKRAEDEAMGYAAGDKDASPVHATTNKEDEEPAAAAAAAESSEKVEEPAVEEKESATVEEV
ncbi:hypothetical protein ACHAXM_009575, partial [Skeletonema potamos]